MYKYILYVNSYRHAPTFDYMTESGQAVPGLHLSAPKVAGPLTHNIMFQKN
jgi:hypothetical protein